MPRDFTPRADFPFSFSSTGFLCSSLRLFLTQKPDFLRKQRNSTPQQGTINRHFQRRQLEATETTLHSSTQLFYKIPRWSGVTTNEQYTADIYQHNQLISSSQCNLSPNSSRSATESPKLSRSIKSKMPSSKRQKPHPLLSAPHKWTLCSTDSSSQKT